MGRRSGWETTALFTELPSIREGKDGLEGKKIRSRRKLNGVGRTGSVSFFPYVETLRFD